MGNECTVYTKQHPNVESPYVELSDEVALISDPIFPSKYTRSYTRLLAIAKHGIANHACRLRIIIFPSVTLRFLSVRENISVLHCAAVDHFGPSRTSI